MARDKGPPGALLFGVPGPRPSWPFPWVPLGPEALRAGGLSKYGTNEFGMGEPAVRMNALPVLSVAGFFFVVFLGKNNIFRAANRSRWSTTWVIFLNFGV